MHVDIEHAQGRVTFTLQPGPGEDATRRVELARRTTSFLVDVPPGQVHPDLLVVCALLCARPWVRPATPFSCAVPASRALADAVRAGPRLTLAHVVDGPARAVPPDGRPGLCFSGGTDSVAALVLLPDTTHSYHLYRRAPEGERRSTMMDGRAAVQSCDVLRRRGRAVTVVPSDVEYLRHPLGFPHDLTTAVPLLLHADVHRLDAVAWGAPLEATYRLQRGRFRDYAESPFVAEWGPVFAVLGLPVCVPIAGVSEVVTSAIVHRHPLGEAAQSCVRGSRLGRPCGRCPKCARKTLLTSAVSGRWPADRALERQWRDTESRQHLLDEPMKVEPVLAHCAHRYLADGGGSTLLRLVAAKSGPDPRDWLTRSYEPALDLLPQHYRSGIAQRLHRFAHPMTAEEEAVVRGYDVTVPDAGRAAAQDELRRWMAAHPARDLLMRVWRRGRRELRLLLGPALRADLRLPGDPGHD
ncbi:MULTISPECIES: DUF6395 domain-containing protein [unclassified Ornithinimicrobium]|uniref:DUF6395 domain-containing protein n=1 Tax=unclassified Ornithinimicrobium TaxID=2615080 RepID=UPI003854A32A